MGAPYRKAKKNLCKDCVFSKISKDLVHWDCEKGKDTNQVKTYCGSYCCGEYDKTTGTKHRKSKCYICGRPIYSSGNDISLYCLEHKAYAKDDDAVLNNMPNELLLCLIAGIFERARDDYLSNARGARKDAKKFFKSDWAQMLTLEGFDPEELLGQLDAEIENGH